MCTQMNNIIILSFLHLNFIDKKESVTLERKGRLSDSVLTTRKDNSTVSTNQQPLTLGTQYCKMQQSIT